MKRQNTVRPITLELEEALWNNFKAIVPRTITLNEALIKLIQYEVEEHEYLDRSSSNTKGRATYTRETTRKVGK